MGSGYPLVMYAFACEPTFRARNFFLAVITISCLLVFVVVMMPKFNKPQYRPIRGFMFVVLGLCMTLPLIYLKNFA
jgi:predicted membrane channel-forming protein YqfA (hemolysin III family)